MSIKKIEFTRKIATWTVMLGCLGYGVVGLSAFIFAEQCDASSTPMLSELDECPVSDHSSSPQNRQNSFSEKDNRSSAVAGYTGTTGVGRGSGGMIMSRDQKLLLSSFACLIGISQLPSCISDIRKKVK